MFDFLTDKALNHLVEQLEPILLLLIPTLCIAISSFVTALVPPPKSDAPPWKKTLHRALRKGALNVKHAISANDPALREVSGDE